MTPSLRLWADATAIERVERAQGFAEGVGCGGDRRNWRYAFTPVYIQLGVCAATVYVHPVRCERQKCSEANAGQTVSLTS